MCHALLILLLNCIAELLHTILTAIFQVNLGKPVATLIFILILGVLMG